MQGISYALYEDFIVDENTGRTLTDSFAGYTIPTILEVPEIEVILVEEGAPSGPYGAKGVGESGLVNVAAAIANAIHDAVGVRMRSLPITPEKIMRALGEKRQIRKPGLVDIRSPDDGLLAPASLCGCQDHS